MTIIFSGGIIIIKMELMKKKFLIGGMSCAACSNTVEKAVNKLVGISSAEVSLIDKSMVVIYDDGIVDEKAIISAVVSAGYTAAIYTEKPKKDEYTKSLLMRFIISGVLLIAILYFSMGQMIGLKVPKPIINVPIQFVLCTLVLAVNYKFFTSGIRAMIHLSPNMDTLITLGTLTAYIYSVTVSIIAFASGNIEHVGHDMEGGGSIKVFFMSSAMVFVFVTFGKFLEELSKKRTGDAIDKLNKYIPDTVTVIKSGEKIKISLSELKKGDTVVIKAGDYVPCDGSIISGLITVDKSAITGESLPEEVSEKGEVLSGSIVKSGYAEFTAEKVGGDALFSKIIERVKSASAKKAPIQRLADKISGVFVPIVTAIALVTFIVWISVTGDLYRSFNYMIDVFVISCPCALGLATPVAVVVSTGVAASNGILFKNAEIIQKSAKINAVLLDKTATLTEGKVKVTEAVFLKDEEYLKRVCYSLEEMSNHPMAESIKEYCGHGNLKVDNYEYIIGKGIKGKIDGKTYFLGSANLVSSSDILEGAQVYLSEGEKTVAAFKCADTLKPNAKAAIEKLSEMNVKTAMITGDNYSVAKTIANETGIDEYFYEVLPENKFQKVEEYKEKGYVVAMCGDGINDSPALSAADVGIAMGTGTDVAIDSSDVVLVSGNVGAISKLIKIAKKSLSVIKGNLFWALIYNVIAIPIAAGALSTVGVSLSPAISAGCMSLSSIFVVLNALRINTLRAKTDKKTVNKKEDSDIFEGEEAMKIYIDGMMCKHCAAKVEDALMKIDGVEKVKINLKKGFAEIKKVELPESVVKKAVEDAGYTFVEIK